MELGCIILSLVEKETDIFALRLAKQDSDGVRVLKVGNGKVTLHPITSHFPRWKLHLAEGPESLALTVFGLIGLEEET